MKLRNLLKILLFFILPIVSGQWLPAKGAVPYILLDSGNANYTKGNYSKAIKFYTSFLDNGVESAQAYYNMGNCYYRLNDMPHALLNYEKAEKLSPGDPDIQFNIQFANQKTIDRISGETPMLLESKWQGFLNTFSEKGWAWLTIGILCLALLLLGVYFSSAKLLLRQISFWSSLIFLILCIFTFSFSVQQYNNLTTHNSAIVMSSSVTVKAAPDDNSVQLFVVHEGTKVWTLKTNGDWTEVKLTNGNTGWLHSGDITEI